MRFDENSKTCDKEREAEEIINLYNVWEKCGFKFKEKVTDKKRQKEGIDFLVTDERGDVYNIDLKTEIGPSYDMVIDDFRDPQYFISAKGLVLELYQSGIFTNTSTKKTDFMLYILKDNSGIYYALVPYKWIHEMSMKLRGGYKDVFIDNVHYREYCEMGGKKLKPHKSFNGSGVFVKLPYSFTKLL